MDDVNKSSAFLIRFANLSIGLRDFFEPDEVEQWIESPQSLLSGRVPLDLLETDEGSAEVFAVLERLRDGAYI